MRAGEFAEIHVEVAAAAGRGWRLFPVEAGGKLPLLKGWPEAATSNIGQLAVWAHQYRACNWGLATGTVSDLVVIDVDGAEGRASLASLERQGLTLPVTLTVATGRAEGGEHRYYRPPSGVEIRNDQSGKIGPRIDVRGTGGFVVCPPSIHASGKQYRFLDSSVPVATLPAWIVERLTVRAPLPGPTVQGSLQVMVKGSRTNTLVSLAGTMTKRGMSLPAITAALLAENTAKCDPPLPEAKVRRIAADIVERYPPGEPVPPVVPALPPMTSEEAARITGELLAMCRAWVKRYIVVSDEQAVIMAAWELHTYVFDTFEVTPYLFISSPEKGSGKSTLLRILKAVSCRGRSSSGMSAAALARVVEASRPTLFLDEIDTQMKGNKEAAESIRGILNSGFEPEGVYTRCVGKDFEVKDFPTFCPKCLAGIGELWDTVSDRSIIIQMRRKLPGEIVEPDGKVAVKAAAAPIKAGLEEWAARGAAELLRSIRPAPISGFNPRQNDIAEVLLAIAHLAGGDWPQRLTQALKVVCNATRAEDGSIGVTLLSDIRAVFDERKADTVPSAILAGRLNEIEGRPWAEWKHGEGITANNLARQLKKFSIYPQTIRVGSETPKGYRRGDFEDDWARYCPLPPTPTAATPQPASLLTENTVSNHNKQSAVAVEQNISKPHEQRCVADVAFAIAQTGAERVYEGEL
jgi:hypothetical protein